jgi:serine protease inhibitor
MTVMRLKNREWASRSVASALLATMSVLGGCGGSSSSGAFPQSASSSLPAAVAQAKDAGTAVNPQIVTADNAFGLSLLQSVQNEIFAVQGPVNVAISPLSVSMALQVLYNGAGGATQQAMAQTLQLGTLTVQQMNDANAALQASLTGADPNVQITIANSLWLHLTNNPVSPSFTQTDQNYYGATVGDISGAPDNVNAWVSSETNGLITKILPAGDYSRDAAIIANAVYFKGEWTTSFDPNSTTPATFTQGDATTTTVQMMHQSGTYSYFQGPDFQMIRLPYGQGHFSMLVLLPDSTVSLDSLVSSMTPAGLDGWIGQMQDLAGSVALPRFNSTFTDELSPALLALGMGSAFACPGADFSALAPSACISSVAHEVVVEVDETGTVAAAATVIAGPTAVRAPSFSMTMDHPFLYAIRDDDTGDLMFVGMLERPGR